MSLPGSDVHLLIFTLYYFVHSKVVSTGKAHGFQWASYYLPAYLVTTACSCLELLIVKLLLEVNDYSDSV